MATIYDETEFIRAMELARYEHNQQWVKHIAITYSESMQKYLATFDCDLTIIFDKVLYKNNSIYFYVKVPSGDIEVAYITHKGLV